MKNAANTNEVLEMLKANSTSKKGSRFKNRTYVQAIPEDLSEIRLSPQEFRIVQEYLNSPEDTWTEKEFFELIQGIEELSKKQENWKVFQYYRKHLLEVGLLEMIAG